jgi:hypothetical protein
MASSGGPEAFAPVEGHKNRVTAGRRQQVFADLGARGASSATHQSPCFPSP